MPVQCGVWQRYRPVSCRPFQIFRSTGDQCWVKAYYLQSMEGVHSTR